MDSKSRQELEKNELAKWIGAAYADWIKPNSGWLSFVVAFGLIAAAVIFGTVRVQSWNHQTVWKQYYAALSSPTAEIELENIANSTTSTVGLQARLTLAHKLLATGSSLLFTDKEGAIVLLERAITAFQQVQAMATDPILLQQAGFGLGQSWEGLAATRVVSEQEDSPKTDLDNAIVAYQNVADRWGDSLLGQRSENQLALLRRPSTVMFLERMAARVIEVPNFDDFKADFDLPDFSAEDFPESDSGFGFGSPESATVSESEAEERVDEDRYSEETDLNDLTDTE